jgi:acetyl-CoA carboxylase biotin carboxylase subunit
MPSPGKITGLHLPHGPGLRIDEGIYEDYKVPFYYDPLLLKLMAWGKNRDEAILRMKRALDEIKIGGIETTILFHRIVMEDELFKSGQYTTDFVEKQRIVSHVREEKRKQNK